jgi:hypothetical protein
MTSPKFFSWVHYTAYESEAQETKKGKTADNAGISCYNAMGIEIT